MVRKISLAVALALGLSPFGVQALGLGEINLKSALNQYLDADISLLSVTGEELDDVRVSLASQEAFNRAGVDRPFILTKLQFKPTQLPGGESVIHLTSRDPIREPFLNFLIEVNWPKGRLVREYTVLLDPPVTLDRRPAPVQTPQAAARVTTADSERVAKDRSVITQGDVSWAGAPTQPSAAMTGGEAGQYGPTQRNDTLWGIAKTVRHDGASMHQMMMALFQSNPEAFISSNINNLRVGRVLRVPDREQVLSLSQREAYAAYSRQVQAWEAERAPVQTAPATAVQKTGQGGQPSDTQTSMPVESGDELKIATARPEGMGEAGPSEGEGEAKSLEELRQDLLIAQEAKAGAEQESTELKSRLTDLESQLDDLQRLLELKNDQLAQLQAVVAATSTPNGAAEESAPMPEAAQAPADEAMPAAPGQETEMAVGESAQATGEESPVMAEQPSMQAEQPPAPVTAPAVEEKPAAVAESEPPKKPAAVKPPVKPTPKPKPGLIEKIMGDTTLLGALIGGIVVLLAALWVWISRRRSNSADFQESILVSTFDEEDDQVGSQEPVSQQTEETSFLSDFSPSDIDALQDETGEVDPLAEADVYIAYGRYQQAEELVRQAIDKDPERIELKHKLAEILYAVKDQDAYTALAEELKSQGVEQSNPQIWGKIISMGAQLAPSAALFSAAALAQSELGAGDEPSADNDEYSLDELTDTLVVGDEEMSATKGEIDFDMDLGLDELDKALNEDTSSLEALGDLGGLTSEEDADIDLGLNLDEETSALDLDEVERLETPLEDELKALDEATDLDEDTDINISMEDMEDMEDMGGMESSEEDEAFMVLDEPTSEVVPLKIGDPMEEAEIADLAGDDEMDFGDLGEEIDLDLSSFQEPAGDESFDIDSAVTDISEEMESAIEEDSYSLADLDMGEDLDVSLDESAAESEDEVSTKLDLARAYIDMGDPDGARDILGEVLDEGNDDQKSAAQQIIDSLG